MEKALYIIDAIIIVGGRVVLCVLLWGWGLELVWDRWRTTRYALEILQADIKARRKRKVEVKKNDIPEDKKNCRTCLYENTLSADACEGCAPSDTGKYSNWRGKKNG